jgi:lipopolysaccharide exporter
MSAVGSTVRGLLLAYGVFVAERGVGLAISLILARVLLPAEFGIVAFALLLVGLTDALRDLGIRDAMVYAQDTLGTAADTAFWLSLALGLAQSAVLLASAPLARELLGDPRIVPLLAALALVPPVVALGQTHEALMLRRLAFQSRYQGDLAACAAKLATAGLAVWLGAGVWSIVVAQLASAVVRTSTRWMAEPWRPRCRFDFGQARTLFHFSLPIFAAGIGYLLADRLDYPITAATLGADALGFYALAVRLPDLVLNGTNLVLGRVMFPTYVALRRDGIALSQAVVATMRYTSFVAVPLGLGMAALASPLVAAAFGDRWLPSAYPMAVLAVAGVVAALVWSIADALKAVGRPGVSAGMAGLNILVSVPLVTVFAMIGGSAFAVALAHLLVTIVMAGLWLAIQRRCLGTVPLRRTFGPAVLAGAAMIAAIAVIRLSLPGSSPLLTLAAAVPGGSLAYAAVLWLLAGKDIRAGLWQLRNACRRQRPCTNVGTVPVSDTSTA